MKNDNTIADVIYRRPQRCFQEKGGLKKRGGSKGRVAGALPLNSVVRKKKAKQEEVVVVVVVVVPRDVDEVDQQPLVHCDAIWI